MSASSDRYFLLEIGCEEIPDWMLLPALGFLQAQLVSLAERERLGSIEYEPDWLGTPRRLSLRGKGLRDRQEDRQVEVAGPRVEAAYDKAGKPTAALTGFARSQGVALDTLVRVRTAKGECMAARRQDKGRSTLEVLALELPGIISRIPFGKTMRWGTGSFRFARPIQWVACLFGSDVVPFEVAGIESGRASRGPRFARSAILPIPDARDYVTLLEKHGVIVDIGRRKELIQEGIRKECARLGKGLYSEDHPDLLNSLTGVVEHPVAAAGSFDPLFLSLPGPVLSTAMIHHQRFIPVRRADGSPAPNYVAVLNCRDEPATVDGIRRGNEWVLRARLRDADFFWKEDRKRTLENRLPDLERVLFEATLGSYRFKVERVAGLAECLCADLARRGRTLDRVAVVRAARLSKSDLTTLLVKEFPELQGIVGGLYAREDGEPEAVCRAISQQYLGAGDSANREPFHSDEGAALAIADRFDTLAGFFLLGRVPTGSRDPYGLRRSALAVVHGALDRDLNVSLSALASVAVSLYAGQGIERRGEGIDRLGTFIEERVRHVCQEQLGLRYDAVNAALAVGADDPLDAVRRSEALHQIRGEVDFEALILSYRRVRNILEGQKVSPFMGDALPSEEELALLQSLRGAEDESAPLLHARRYPQALKVMAGLRSPLDRFFEKVLVMDPDPVVRGNRLGLLKRVSNLLLRVGDFAAMVLEGESASVSMAGGRRG